MAYILARTLLRQAAQTALTDAQVVATVDSPGDWVTQPTNLPAILLRPTRTRKEAELRGPMQFDSTITIEIESRAEATAGMTAQEAIEALDGQIEQALLTNHGFVSLLQKVTIETDTEINAEARMHFGATKWALHCEIYEAFDPVCDAPQALQPVAVPLAGIDINADLAAPFDPNGAYADPPFPAAVPPAPRTSGPDGRDEGLLQINLPQQEEPCT